jgi:hypothetical protein
MLRIRINGDVPPLYPVPSWHAPVALQNGGYDFYVVQLFTSRNFAQRSVTVLSSLHAPHECGIVNVLAEWDGDCKLWRCVLAWKDDPAWGFPVHVTGLAWRHMTKEHPVVHGHALLGQKALMKCL